MSLSASELPALLQSIRACTTCAAALSHGPRPVLRASPTARLLIAGQAPGTRVHATGIPWNDPSGERLRDWMQLDAERFYDESLVAIVPMGFCYPGKGTSGDLPPRRECAAQWHGKLIPMMPNVELVLAVGQYAQAYFLGDARKSTLTETVRAFESYLPRVLPLPHPSPRNQGWFKHNAWFAAECLPILRQRIARILPMQPEPAK